MKRIILFPIWLWAAQLLGQQESMMTQFMYQRLLYNPAYAGSYDVPELVAGARHQWIGFDGAPSVQTVSFATPLGSKKFGAGIHLDNEIAGYESKQTIGLCFSYAIIRTSRWSLRGGMQMSMRRYGFDFKKVELTTDPDFAVGQNFETLWAGNFGVGLYATFNDWYVGIGMPFLYNNILGLQTNTPDVAKEYLHFFGIAGLNIPFNDKMVVKLNGLLKAAANATWVGDYNANFVYDEHITVGLTYRTGQQIWKRFPESIDLLVFSKINKHLGMGISYDIVLSSMAAQQKGSIELALQYRWQKPIFQLSNPRGYF